MKTTAIFISILFISGLCFRSVPPEKKFIPPGTVEIAPGFFADKTEITNSSWREYEFWISKKHGSNSPEHQAALPDSTVWTLQESYNPPYSEHYYRHKAYSSFPVVGISHEQAIAFCKWRTERVKEAYFRKYHRVTDIAFRLPTEAEWQRLSHRDGLLVNDQGRRADGKTGINCRKAADNDSRSGTPPADVTAPVFSYIPNDLGLWQCLGNVAEMVLEPQVSKGGSWKHTADECRPDTMLGYQGPTAWLGFRCVAETSARQP